MNTQLSRLFYGLTNWMYGLPFGAIGKELTTHEVLSYAPIWSACQKIGGHVASLPKSVYKRVEGGAEKEENTPTAKLLRKPNAYQIGPIFYEQMMVHSLLDGNGRAAIVKAGTRDYLTDEMLTRDELIPLLPEHTATGMLAGEKLHATRPQRDDRLRRFVPDSKNEFGTHGMIVLKDEEVVHLVGLTTDGVSGIPLKMIAYRNLKGAIDTERRFGTQMEKGYSGGMMLNSPPGVFRKQEDAQEFLDWFRREHDGTDNAGKTGMLREGITAQILSGTNKDAEMLATRVFQRQDAALWMGLESILGDDDSVSYNSLAEKNRAYLLNTLSRWIVRLEQELTYKILPKRQVERNTHYVKVETDQLLRADYATTVSSLATLITSTIISPNEARKTLDMLPYEGGDVYGNPAITPGESESSEEEPSESSESDNAATVARIRQLIKTEGHRVQQGTKKPNYLDFIDAFYAHWEPKLADWLEEMGCDRELASVHCEQSRNRLLEVCDTATTETLAGDVERCVESWPNRANLLVEKESQCLITT